MAGYDSFADTYDHIIRKRLPINELSFQFILKQIDEIKGRKICDLGCGQGELSRRLIKCGGLVTGVDISQDLLRIARSYPDADAAHWVKDDAQSLQSVSENEYDFVVSSLMLMDLPDFQKVFDSSYRILKPKGKMIWVITHPCFQSPYSETTENGMRIIKKYAEQWWKSEGEGTIRGTLGAYHRPLEKYINSFISTGFRLLAMKELTIPKEVPLEGRQRTHHEIPPLIGVVGVKV
ncbi:class I SAM-dependent methyltransferase [Lederbergia sp. NSJ-179]|uniref:class I SAM-dependent methyltransferase n=1 Tax=Lederbergia sp. NSJ-179 TaxID=2931402 RepID=UPI001FD12942|nr:class I SAM-dependent methyltransferase [Lederbergia sp. NSJ-179]MCJ7839782.1 class I SAM-dependent methyltransferase [Lederbergia sp. NSJ-179]